MALQRFVSLSKRVLERLCFPLQSAKHEPAKHESAKYSLHYCIECADDIQGSCTDAEAPRMGVDAFDDERRWGICRTAKAQIIAVIAFIGDHVTSTVPKVQRLKPNAKKHGNSAVTASHAS